MCPSIFFPHPPPKNTMTISCPKFAILTTSLHPKTRPFAQWIRLRIPMSMEIFLKYRGKVHPQSLPFHANYPKNPSDSIRDPEISPSWRPRPAIEGVTKKPSQKGPGWSPPACRVVLGTPQFSLEVAWLNPQKCIKHTVNGHQKKTSQIPFKCPWKLVTTYL